VASFEAVGSVLVIAFLACPALIAAPHARSVRGQIALSLAAGAAIATGAYFLAAFAPQLFGARSALNAAGMISAALAAAVPLSHIARSMLNRRRA
jgi:ABC-type Mn2+/Zn2+ transport system permease subunit